MMDDEEGGILTFGMAKWLLNRVGHQSIEIFRLSNKINRRKIGD